MTGSIRYRGPRTWGLTISLGLDQNGKRIRKHLTVKGTKRDAERELRHILADIDAGLLPSTERIKLRDWLPRWKSEYGTTQNWRQSTFDRYTLIINNVLIPELGNVEIDKILPRNVQRLQLTLIKGGMKPKGVQLSMLYDSVSS